MISIYMTERASRKVRTLLASGPGTADFGLRIGVDPGGCSGYQYRLVLAPRADPDEVVVAQDGFDVFVGASAAPLLAGVRIDYVESIASSGFTFDNPNAADSCGCGTSFSATRSAEQSAADAALHARVEDAMAEIRPYLQGEGGDVTVVGVADGVVSVRLTGACDGCSSALGTITSVIERRLKEALPGKEAFPGVERVALVT